METDFPEPPKLTSGRKTARTKVKTEQRKIGLEMAAMAYVQMENGVYRYPEGAQRGNKLEDGSRDVNRTEVMRRAGYSNWTAKTRWSETLAKNQEFWDLVELYRLRFSDPAFAKGSEHYLWAEIGNDALKNLYERIHYYPHTLSTTDILKIAHLAIDAGLVPVTEKTEVKGRAQSLIEGLSEDDRQKALEGYRRKLERDIKSLDALEGAYRAADRENV